MELSGASYQKEKHLLAQPQRFFQTKRMNEVPTEDLLAFREHRSKTNVGPATINMGMGVIGRMLKRAKRWHLFAGELKPLKERPTIGRALMPYEKLRLLHFAARNPDWQTARLAAILALNTTMRACEIKQLRWRDIDLIGQSLTIQKSKTNAGERLIPRNGVACAAVLELRERARTCDGGQGNISSSPRVRTDTSTTPSRRRAGDLRGAS